MDLDLGTRDLMPPTLRQVRKDLEPSRCCHSGSSLFGVWWLGASRGLEGPLKPTYSRLHLQGPPLPHHSLPRAERREPHCACSSGEGCLQRDAGGRVVGIPFKGHLGSSHLATTASASQTLPDSGLVRTRVRKSGLFTGSSKPTCDEQEG